MNSLFIVLKCVSTLKHMDMAKKNRWFPVTRPILLLTPDPLIFLNKKKERKKTKCRVADNTKATLLRTDAKGCFLTASA